MAKVILICGKIACGKTFYANKLKIKENAVILNTDELTCAMFDNQQGEQYMDLANRANTYLMKKAIQIVQASCNVILDWGFWKITEREYITEYFKNKNINIECHYINISDNDWKINIQERNKRLKNQTNSPDFYVTEGLIDKVINNFEIPDKNKIDVWYNFKRE